MTPTILRLMCFCVAAITLTEARKNTRIRRAADVIVAGSPFTKYEACLKKHNITFRAYEHASGSHVYRILENCLYYELNDIAERKAQRSNVLQLEAPLKKPGDVTEKISVRIVRGVVKELTDPDGDLKEMSMRQEFNIEWDDYRLTWNKNEWDIDYIDIQSSNDIWTPDIQPQPQSIESSYWYDDLRVYYDGRVAAKYAVFVKPKCDINFQDYPNDKHRCCYVLRNKMYSHRVVFDEIDNMAGDVTKSYAGGVWSVEHFYLIRNELVALLRQHTLDVCVVAVRAAGTLRIELGMPVLAVVALVVSAPLFGDMRTQCYVKMFGLAVQVLSLMFLGQATPREAFAGHTPKLYRFYEFSMVATTTSFLMTVVLMAIARQPRKIPPSHSVYLIAAAINLHLCCLKVAFWGGNLGS